MKRMIALFILLALLFGEAGKEREAVDEMRITFFNIGAQDSILIQCGGESMLVDSGTRAGGRKVVQYLKEMGVEHIDYALNTHPHDDHIDGFIDIFEEISVGSFMVCFPPAMNENIAAAVKAAQKNEIPIVEITDEADISFGGNQITLYRDMESQHTNYRSMVMRVGFGERAALLLADVGRPVQKRLAESEGEALRADILKLAHHGQSQANPALLDAVQPQICILTNAFNASTGECVEALEKRGISVLSMYGGNVEFSTDGERWTCEQKRPSN